VEGGVRVNGIKPVVGATEGGGRFGSLEVWKHVEVRRNLYSRASPSLGSRVLRLGWRRERGEAEVKLVLGEDAAGVSGVRGLDDNCELLGTASRQL
jgi:hypothetical protein